MPAPRRYRCDTCGRIIFEVDFERRLAELECRWRDTLGGPECDEVAVHTYDCDGEKRRLTRMEES